jgi:deoxyribose-phosphate aldolase
MSEKSRICDVIEHTILSPDLTVQEFEDNYKFVVENNIKGICFNSCFSDFGILKKQKKKYQYKPNAITVIDFPLGSSYVKLKSDQIDELVSNFDYLDIVVNIGFLKGSNNYFKEEMQDLSNSYVNKLRLILEVAALTDKELETTMKTVVDLGFKTVKTSTGFYKIKLTNSELCGKIDLMRKYSSGVKIKASGGIKTYQHVLNVLSAGASIVGTSSTKDILGEI